MIVLDAFGSRKKTLGYNSATPTVTNIDVGVGNYDTVVTITNFLQRVNVDQFFLFVNNYDGTIIQHNGTTIKLLGNGNLYLKNNDIIFFWKNSATGIWSQIGGANLYN